MKYQIKFTDGREPIRNLSGTKALETFMKEGGTIAPDFEIDDKRIKYTTFLANASDINKSDMAAGLVKPCYGMDGTWFFKNTKNDEIHISLGTEENKKFESDMRRVVKEALRDFEDAVILRALNLRPDVDEYDLRTVLQNITFVVKEIVKS